MAQHNHFGVAQTKIVVDIMIDKMLKTWSGNAKKPIKHRKEQGEEWRQATMVAVFLNYNKNNDDGDGEENSDK